MDRADAVMRVLSGANAGKVLRFRDAVTIGSAPDCHLVLDDPGIAHHHATIEPREPFYRLLAHAPTFIGSPHEQPRAISDADLPTICMLDFGTTSVMFEICGGSYKGDPTIHAVPSPPPAFATPQIAIELNRLHRQVRGAGVALLDDDRVLIAGGMPPMHGDGYRTAELFSIRAHEGRDIAMASARRDCCAAKLTGGRILVIGGETASAELFDPDSETFVPAPNMHVSRNYARMVALPDGRAFVIGGHREVVSEIFDPSANRWFTLRGPMQRGSPVQFEHAQAVVVAPTKLFVVVQDPGNHPRPPQTYFVLDLQNWKWDPIAESAAPRSASTAVALQHGRALVIGGIANGQWRQHVDLFDLATGTLEPVGELRSYRSGFGVVALPTGQALVVGGDSLGSGLYSAEIFDPTTCTWRGLPAVRDGFPPVGLCARSDGSVVGVTVGSVCLLG